MSIRTETIAGIFQMWLKRYSPPQIMKHDEEVMREERNALLRVLLKFAPDRDYEQWVSRVLDRLEYQMKTRAWPTKGELGSVCSNLRKEGRTGQEASVHQMRTSAEINAERIEKGEPVGDGWLYGRNAVELLGAGLVTREALRKLRSALYFRMKDAWGEEQARTVEASLIRRHEMAERVSSSKTRIAAPQPTAKRMPQSEWDAA